MYIVREMERAVGYCNNGCESTDCIDDAVHALDKAVAFYTGSTVSAENRGKLLYYNAEKGCQSFNTCSDGIAHVNTEVFAQFNMMQNNLLQKQCDASRLNKNRIVELMYVPMIQGTLQYAYRRDELDCPEEKSVGQGATFAAAVLPIVHACNENDAEIMYNNMKVLGPKPNFTVVKAAFERNYGCMRITCEDVGGFHNGTDYYPKAAPCSLSKRSSSSINVGATVGDSIILAVALAFVVYLFCRRRWSVRSKYETKQQYSMRKLREDAVVREKLLPKHQE